MSLSICTRIVLAVLLLLGACTPRSREAPAARSETGNCKTMKIPPAAELDTNLDKRNEIIEVAYLGDEGIDEHLVIRYMSQRCRSNPDTMRVITHVLRTASVAVPLPSLTTAELKDCPPPRHIHTSWYFAQPCSPPLEEGVTYEFFLSTSCDRLPDFDGSFWELDRKQEREHARHLSSHHRLNGTITITGPDNAVFEMNDDLIKLSRHEGGHRACSRD